MPERFAQTLEIVKKDSGVDGLLVTLSPQGMTDPAEVASRIQPFAHMDGKPILASWMGGESVARGIEILNAAGIPTFPYSDSAARAFSYMWQYSENLRVLYETAQQQAATTDRQTATSLLERARAEGRVLLTGQESKCLLAAYAIPITRTEIAATEEAAVRLAVEIGFPVMLKLHSHTVTHKTDVGGVELNLRNESDVRSAWKRIKSTVAARSSAGEFEGVTVQPMIRLADAYELILGSSTTRSLVP